MEIVFAAEGLTDIVNNKTEFPAEVTEQKVWNEQNAKAMLLISTSMEFSQLQTVIACQKAAEMWKRLKSIHEQRSSVNKITLKQHFFNYKMSSTNSISQHISKIESMAQALSDVGEPVSDVDKIAKVLGSLPPKYGAFITAWDSYDESKQTFENLTSRLLKEELKFSQDDDTSSALAAININSRAAYKQSTDNKAKGKANIICYYCNKKGHYKSECRKRLKDQNSTIKSNPNSRHHQALSAETKNFKCINGKDEWLADSAASKHMSFRRDWFNTFTELRNEVSIQIGDNSYVYAQGIGTIEVEALVNGAWEPRTLEDTLYVPELKKNLFSIGATTNKKLQVIFDSETLNIQKGNRLIAVGTKQTNQCYKMVFKSLVQQANSATENEIMLWHNRMGHVNFKSLKEMSDKGDIPIKIKNIDNLFCEACQFGKSHRAVYPRCSKTGPYKPGEYIYSDVCGKIQETSIGGANYFVIFKDRTTCYRYVFFIKHKSDVFSKFLEVEKLIHRQTGNVIKVFRSDNGTEYVNHNFKEHFKTKGIIHETCAPYTPEQNGNAERDLRSILESARTMLSDCSLTQELWAEAVNTSVYLLNRRPTQDIEKKTPYEKWTGKSLRLNHLKQFGSEAYVYIPGQFRSKFQNKCKKMYLVGYANDSINYRVYNLETKEVIISKNVTFNEKHKNSESTCEITLNTENDEGKGNIDRDNSQVESDQNNVIEYETSTNDFNTGKCESTRNLRNRSKLNKPLRYDNDYLACAASVEEPQTYKEAIHCRNKDKWEKAINEELTSLQENSTWKLVELPDDKKAIGCKWVFKVKQDADTKLTKYKARLCAKGYNQREGIDYEETFSPVIRYDSLRTLLALATKEDMEVKQFDVATAFLNGDLTEEIYMKQPEGYETENKDLVCKLQKSLYGLKQASKCWNDKFKHFITIFGFEQLNADKCIFYTESDGEAVFLALYVDDGLIISKNITFMHTILEELDRKFKITVKPLKYFVGVEIERNRKIKETFICQRSYIDRILRRFKMEDCKPKSVPIPPGTILMCEDKTVEQSACNKAVPYREAIGSLMFLATTSRPDIMFAVNMVSRHVNNPQTHHWEAVKHILRYLKGTLKLGIRYSGNNTELTVYSDADYAGDIETRHSTTGYVSVLCEGPITWSSQRQRCVSRSTTESEYIAASDAARETVWLRGLLAELKVPCIKPTILYVDNQSAIKLVQRKDSHKRTKHIDVRYHYIRELVESNQLMVEYIPSDKQLADIFTKLLPKDRFVLGSKELLYSIDQ